MNLNVSDTFTIKLTMTSDWHIGSGSGRGKIDSSVQRDQNGLPYIPAKTLTGILRDACELVALGLDNGQEGIWQEWVNCLFGEQPSLATGAIETPPRPAALSIRSAHLLKTLRDALVAKPALKDAIAFIKPGISIDPTSGCAIRDFLRFEEMIRQGAVLETGECHLTLPPNTTDEQKKAAYALLVAGAQMVERLGGKRRRGAGLCKIQIDTNSQQWLEWLDGLFQQKTLPSPPEFNEPDDLQQQNTVPAIESDWYTLPLEITTLSPVIINARTIGNVVETLDYIPGKHFLRILHKKLGRWINMSHAIANGDLIITNATISIDNQFGRPTPFCLSAEKIDGGLDKGSVYNLLVEEKPTGIQLKGIRGGYVGTVGNGYLPPYKKVDLQLYTHNVIQDDVQRPTSDVGGVYSYQAIPSETILKAELRLKGALVKQLDRSKSQKNWWERLKGKQLVGQSKKDDYGLIDLKAPSAPTQFSPNLPTSENALSVWLLSDVLLRNSRLRPTTDLEQLRQKLETALGVKLTEKSVMVRQRRTDTWQVRWGLARPSLAGLQAGSCMVYEVTEGTLNQTRLAEVQASGIGERRVEGYGQICFNDALLTTRMSPLMAQSQPKDDSNSNSDSPEISKEDSAFVYAQIIEKEAWRAEIQRQVLALASDANSRYRILGIKLEGSESKPSMTQLGALKSVIRRLQKSKDAPRVLGWIESIESVPNRRDKWENGSLETISRLIGDTNQIWQEIHIPGDLNLTKSTKEEDRPKNQLWAEAVRTLIDACIRAHKRDWENAVNATEKVGA